MPARKSVISLKVACLDRMVKTYAATIASIQTDEDITSARQPLQKLPCQLLSDFIVALFCDESLRNLLRDVDVNILFRILVLENLQELCLICDHSLDEKCDLKINVDLGHAFPCQKMYLNTDKVFKDMITSESKLTNLHIQEIPENIVEIVRRLPNLKCLLIDYNVKCSSKDKEKQLIRDLVCELEKKTSVIELHLIGVSVPSKALLTLKKMKHLKLLDLRHTDVLPQTAVKLLCELPNIEKFGWSNGREDSRKNDTAFFEFYNNAKKCNQHGNCVRKIRKWLGHVQPRDLTKGDKAIYKLLNLDCRGFVCPGEFLPDPQITFMLDYPEVVVCEIKGNFEIISLLKQQTIYDFELKRIIYFNSKLITHLDFDMGNISANTVAMIAHLCVNLQSLHIDVEFVEDDRCPKMYKDYLPVPSSFDTPPKLLKLEELWFSLQHDDTTPTESLHIAERVCLRKLLANTPVLKIAHISMGKNRIDDEMFPTLLPSTFEKLEVFMFEGDRLDMSETSLNIALERIPCLNTIGDLMTWKKVSKECVENLKHKTEENLWNLSVICLGYPDDCAGTIDENDLASWMNNAGLDDSDSEEEEEDYSDFEGMDDDSDGDDPDDESET